MVQVKYEKMHPHAKPPVKKIQSDGCWDISCVTHGINIGNNILEYNTGLVIDVPWKIRVLPRSSICNYSLRLINSPAVIDQTYRRTILLKYDLILNAPEKKVYEAGDRIAQIEVVLPDGTEATHVEWIEVAPFLTFEEVCLELNEKNIDQERFIKSLGAITNPNYVYYPQFKLYKNITNRLYSEQRGGFGSTGQK